MSLSDHFTDALREWQECLAEEDDVLRQRATIHSLYLAEVIINDRQYWEGLLPWEDSAAGEKIK